MNELTDKKSPFKDKFACPEMETMEKDGVYTFSLSPDYSLNTNVDYKLSLQTWYKKIEGYLNELNFSDVYLHVELSHTGRPHLHGYIGVLDVVGFYAVDLPLLQKIGTYAIKHIGFAKDVEAEEWINAHDKWLKYMLKQEAFIAGIFRKRPYPMMTYNINKISKKDIVISEKTENNIMLNLSVRKSKYIENKK